ncbi:probable G-protein coupled receptor CG31760 [Thrips palmi]|uniref:Probable G-protein coupled receptor CG31760 n=1 Tax=Thrips palmi TaxID=161013 RepID=A0A6P8Y1V9_THRPL|nr:probable G-protein coupled receptor CG31760 [Thrips palmi]
MGPGRVPWVVVGALLVLSRVLSWPGAAALDALTRKDSEDALQLVHDVSTGSLGALCLANQHFRSLSAAVDPRRYDPVRQKADMAALVLKDLGVAHHAGLLDAVTKALLLSERHVLAARILTLNASNGDVLNMVEWKYDGEGLSMSGPSRTHPASLPADPADLPWYEDAATSPTLRSPKFVDSPANVSYKGWWTFPYFSCSNRRWLLSYSVPVAPTNRHMTKGFLSLDVDLSSLEVNQCEPSPRVPGWARRGAAEQHQVAVFHGTHKCDNVTTQCVHIPGAGWARGSYYCRCRPGFYSPKNKGIFNGTVVEQAWQEYEEQQIQEGQQPGPQHQAHQAGRRAPLSLFQCLKCAPGCDTCRGPDPCLANYNWPFRISLLVVSVCCVVMVLALAAYVFHNRRIKVFKVASPIFLAITLLGCAMMYLELAAIFPVLDLYSCIATKWTRHLGFCITYTALLMKTWRVSLTYRVKSAHKVKLTDKQLLQWMFPILLVMLIFLGAWTLSMPPQAEVIRDSAGLAFKQCQYNWWDHSLSIGEVLFLLWGIKVCYNVRNAESLYNEARLISYAIYNIAIVNTTMVAFHLFIFPHAGPDIKYLLGFIRTQLSTSVTVGLVFAPKVVRVLRGQGDQWDNRARARGVTASFSLNGIGLVPEETADLYQENEELKEEIQKLAAQIEFSKIVAMEVHNRHLKPKPGGYFSQATAVTLQSPQGGQGGASIRTTTAAASAFSAFSAPQPGSLADKAERAGNNGGLFRGRNSMGDESLASSTSPAASAEALGLALGSGSVGDRAERLDRV